MTTHSCYGLKVNEKKLILSSQFQESLRKLVVVSRVSFHFIDLQGKLSNILQPSELIELYFDRFLWMQNRLG